MVIQRLPCQAPGVNGSAPGLAGPMSLHYTVTGSDTKSDLLLLSQCSITYSYLNRSVPEIFCHVAGTLSNQQTTTASSVMQMGSPSPLESVKGPSLPPIVFFFFTLRVAWPSSHGIKLWAEQEQIWIWGLFVFSAPIPQKHSSFGRTFAFTRPDSPLPPPPRNIYTSVSVCLSLCLSVLSVCLSVCPKLISFRRKDISRNSFCFGFQTCMVSPVLLPLS